MNNEDLHPDWGTPEYSMINGELVGNGAAILKLMREGGNDRSRKAYRALCKKWREIKDLNDMTAAEKQVACMNAGLSVNGDLTIMMDDKPGGAP